MFDAFANNPAASVPQNVSVWVESAVNTELASPEAVEARQGRRLQAGPDYVLLFSPVANDRCAWKPF